MPAIITTKGFADEGLMSCSREFSFDADAASNYVSANFESASLPVGRPLKLMPCTALPDKQYLHVNAVLPARVNCELSEFQLAVIDSHAISPLYLFGKVLQLEAPTKSCITFKQTSRPEPQDLSHDVLNGYTTLTFRGLPRSFTKQCLLDFLNKYGQAGKYDFIYLPFEFKRLESRGYAIVNMVSHAAAWSTIQHLSGFSNWEVPTARVLNVCWSDLQGLDEHVQQYRSSPIMHEAVPEEYKPSLFKDGVPITFPDPRTRIRAPSVWRVKHRNASL